MCLDGVVEDLGGPEAPGIGFAMSMERLFLALEAEGESFGNHDSLDMYVVSMGDAAKDKALSLVSELRENNMTVEMDFLDRKVKAQMKSADRLQAKFVVVIGDTELETGKVALKNLSNGTQKEMTFEEIVENAEQLKLSWQEELA